MFRNFKKQNQRDKQRYLRYDDVFLGGGRARNDSHNFQSRQDNNRNYFEDEQIIEESDVDYSFDQPQDSGYFSGKNSIIDERMVKYQKRQLPPLQRYSPNSHRDQYSEYNQAYWDEDYSSRRNPNFHSLKQLWRKFIVTFASIVSLVCVAWIAYNWNNNPQQTQNRVMQNGIPLIEPEQQNFRVLPDDPGGAEISYKDKTVYERVNNRPISVQEKLLPPQQEETHPPVVSKKEPQVEEYSIVDDKTYYIKISAGKTKAILQSELNLLKKKYPDLVDGQNSAIKRVSNSNGEKKDAILIGPFDSQDVAIETAKNLGGQCYVISVKG